MGSFNEFLYQKLVLFCGSFWVCFTALFFALFGPVNKLLIRVQAVESTEKSNSNCLVVASPTKEETEFDEPKHDDSIEFSDTESSEEETTKFFFKFKFQTYEELNQRSKGNWDLVPYTSTSKCESKSNKYFSGFIEEPKDLSFTVKEFKQENSGEETVHEEEPENFRESACKEEVAEKTEEEIFSEDSKQTVGGGEKEQTCECNSGVMQFLSEKDFVALDSDSDSIASSNEFSFMSHLVASTSDGFLSDGHFENESDDFDDEDNDTMEELEKLQATQALEMLSEKDFHAKKVSKTEEVAGTKDSNQSNMQNSSTSFLDTEDTNGLETQWEHQDLIEQLQMELKKVRAIGLPTILEESESPKIVEDLKPWKIDEKFQHEDRMGELHKFYKGYRERMRKFDILNYQKMYAIGFLQSKDPLQSISSLKSAPTGMTSLLPQNFLPGKQKKSEFDPMKKFIKELHSDLEVVYVGQLCLSWEILHWQYEKAWEIWESDPYAIRRYNEVAGEFQQFQVLMQRFIENEPFEGPRVQNYIKNRCVLRNLLQVPVIREDSKKDKKARMKGRDNYAITSDMLVEIMEESIRIFWRFVRADKDAHVVIQKCRKGTQVEPKDALDLELLAEVKTCLQKKEKKLKDILRSGNCILRKFQKHQDNADQVLYFFSQVDMKLVARVLNMSKVTTDQLLWCRNKLNKINFVSRKIHVEPSFLLFPC